MYGYKYSEDESLNDLIIDYCSEFDCIFIKEISGKFRFESFNKYFDKSRNQMLLELASV